MSLCVVQGPALLDVLMELEGGLDAEIAFEGGSGGNPDVASADAPPPPNGEAQEEPAGLLAKLADPSQHGLRATVHRRHDELLNEDSPLADTNFHGGNFRQGNPLSERRKHVLQQDADFWIRFDVRYECAPNTLFVSKLDGDLEDCCLDPFFTRRAKTNCGPEVFDEPEFTRVMQHVSTDDSVSTIVENERQHGRHRISARAKNLGPSAINGYLDE